MLMSGARLTIQEQYEAEWGDGSDDKSDYMREHDNTKLVLHSTPQEVVDEKEIRSWYALQGWCQFDINIRIVCRVSKEHKQIQKFATRWVEGLRALMRAWQEGDEKGKARRLAMLEACRQQAPSEEAAALVEQNAPWCVFLSLMSQN